MFHIVLYEPEIPPNTGNIIRLSANTGAQLHLIHPLGFNLDDRQLRRAGLDYHEYADLQNHHSWDDCRRVLSDSRWFAFSTKANRYYTEEMFQPGDVFLFGPETRGLPVSILSQFSREQCLKIPMASNSRSFNLSNAVAIIVLEAWRQNQFKSK